MHKRFAGPSDFVVWWATCSISGFLMMRPYLVNEGLNQFSYIVVVFYSLFIF